MGEVLRTIETARAARASTSPPTCTPTRRGRPRWRACSRCGRTRGAWPRSSAGSPTARPATGSSTAAGRPSGRVERAERRRRLDRRHGGRVSRGCRASRGGRMAEIAAARRAPAEEVFIDLLLEADGQVSMINFLMLDANVARGLQFPHVTIGSDNLGLCAGPEARPSGETPPPAARLLREGPGHLRPRARGAQLGGRGPQDDRAVGGPARARRPWRPPPRRLRRRRRLRSGDGRRPGDLPGLRIGIRPASAPSG